MRTLFTYTPTDRAPVHPLRRPALVVSVVLHAALVVLLIFAPLFRDPEKQYRIVYLSPLPPPSLLEPKLSPPPVRKLERMRPPVNAHRFEEKKPEPPKTPPKPIEMKRVAELPKPKPEPVVSPPRPELPSPVKPSSAPAESRVKTGVFPGAGAPPVKGQPSAREVQTGGFGTPHHTSPAVGPGGTAKDVTLGSFGSPEASGPGTGLGRGRSQRGTVAGSVFGTISGAGGTGGSGSGTGGSGNGGNGEVRKGGFGDFQPSASAPQPRARAAQAATQPVEILFKPKPAYTQEARKLGLEGEVTVEVLFTASGQVRVMRVVRGLGHGLDRAAIHAAEQIRFKPAQLNGKPVDSRVTVRIVFLLS